jgi:hypothetical protein
MGFQTFPAAGGTASFAGVFIPFGDLANGGIQANTEFADSVAANIKRDKGLLATLEVLTAYIDSLTADLKLGISVIRPTVQSLTWNYSLTYQAYELRNGSTPLAPLPVPVSGANSGKGDIAITDAFPNAAKVASAATISGAGVLIESAPLARQGAPAHASLSVDGDNRDWFNALFRWAANDATAFPVRSASAASAITAKTPSTPSIFTLPAAATASTNPTTNLSASDLDVIVPVQFTTSLTIQLALSSISGQTWDVNSVTA